MDIEGIREALHQHPFEPFNIRLADARSLHVPHRDYVALGKRRIVVVSKDDRWTIIEPLLIVSLDKDSPKGKNGNGSHKRKRPGN